MIISTIWGKSLKIPEKVQKILAVVLLLVIWQAAASLLNQKVILAGPVSVVGRVFELVTEKGFFKVLGFSFLRIAGGFLLGLVLGTALAVLAAKIKAVGIILQPVMLTIKSVPVASFIIIALVWLTSSSLSSFISFLMVLPVIYNNVLGGIRSIDTKMLQMAEIYRLPWNKRFVFIWLPAMEPYLTAACSVSLGLCWKAGTAAEVIGIPSGSVGEMLYQAKAYLNTVDLFAWTVIIVLVSLLFEKAFLFLLKRVFKRIKEI